MPMNSGAALMKLARAPSRHLPAVAPPSPHLRSEGAARAKMAIPPSSTRLSVPHDALPQGDRRVLKGQTAKTGGGESHDDAWGRPRP